MKAVKLLFWFSLFIGLVLSGIRLVTENSEDIIISLYNMTTEPHPKWLVVLISFLAGACLAALFFGLEIIVLEAKNIRLRRNLTKAERALKEKIGPDQSIEPQFDEDGLEKKSRVAT